ncbi:MAG: hypothetical protein JST96_10990, partial [Bacteroidetes bacterium]|nr:hypothetical protein [Bacteroidota bacterium]
MYNIYFQKVKRTITRKIIRICLTGITTTEDYFARINIILMNASMLASIGGLLINTILFLVFGYYIPGIVNLGCVIFLFLLMRLNMKGKNLQAKVSVNITVNIIILVSCCIFTHNGALNCYFEFMAAVCMYFYTWQERKWGILMVSLSIILFVIESSSLKHYLPSLNLISAGREFNIANNIILCGLVFMLVSQMGVFVLFAEIRENKLNNIKLQLLISQQKLRRQNDD